MFSEAVLEHFRRPRHNGGLGGDERTICSGQAGAVKSGAQVRIELRLGTDGVIVDVGWQAYGCPATLAAASWLAEQVKGHPAAEAASITALDISRALALAPERRARAMIVEDAFRAALGARPGQSSINRK